MATASETLKMIISAEDRTRGVFGRVGRSVADFGNKAKRAAQIATAALIAIGVAAFAAAIQVDKATRKIQVGTGATGKALKRLKRDFAAVFKTVPQSAEEVGQTIATLNTLFNNLQGQGLRRLAKKVLDLSRLMGGSASQNASSFGRTMKQFNINALDSEAVLDKLFLITQQTGIGFGKLIEDLREFGPVLQLANISVEEGAVLIGRLAKEGINFTRVSPALRQGFIKWGKEGKNVREELIKVIAEIKNTSTESEGAAVASKIFGSEVARLVKVIRGGLFTLDDLGKGIGNAGGSIERSLELTRQWSEEIGILKNTATIALAPVGEAFLRVFKEVRPQIVEFINLVGKRMPDIVLNGFQLIASSAPFLTQAIVSSFSTIKTLVGGLQTSILLVQKAFFGIRKFTTGFEVRDLERVIPLQEAQGKSVEELKERLARVKETLRETEIIYDAINVALDRVAASTVDNLKNIVTAETKSQAVVDIIEGLRKKYELVSQSNEEVNKVMKKTEEIGERLPKPINEFSNSITVAGKRIDVNINQSLDQTIAKIRQIKREAATMFE